MEYTHIIDALIETIDQLKTKIETREKALGQDNLNIRQKITRPKRQD